MTAGQHLDLAAARLNAATAELAKYGRMTSNDFTTTVAARDHVYRSLLRLMNVLNFRFPGPHLALPDAGELARRALGTGEGHDLALAAIVQAAHLDTPGLPGHPGAIAGLLVRAADAISSTADIIATHIAPRTVTQRGTSLRYLTNEAAALLSGHQRNETAAAIARLASQALNVDKQLLQIPHDGWDRLSHWANSDAARMLANLGTAQPATLLHGLGTAPFNRPGASLTISSWADIAKTIALARSAIRRDPELATAHVVRSTARLGFASAAAAWRMSGTGQPARGLQSLEQQWRFTAMAFLNIADIRDGIPSPVADSLDRAKEWIRQRTSGQEILPDADSDAIREAHQQLAGLAADLQDPLQEARSRGELFTPQTMPGVILDHNGEVTNVQGWALAGPSDSHILTAMRAIRQTSHFPLPWRHGIQANTGAAAITPGTLLSADRVAGAWPQSVRRGAENGAVQQPARGARPARQRNRHERHADGRQR